MARARIKKDEMVVVISGKDRDLTTPRRVLQVDPSAERVLVEGVNMVKRHTKPNPQRNIKGGVLEREAPIHVSNLMLVCPRCGNPTRVGVEMLADGGKARRCKREDCGQQLDS